MFYSTEFEIDLSSDTIAGFQNKYVLDVLWGQPIKLIQVTSNSEFFSLKLFPLIASGLGLAISEDGK